MTNDPAIPPPPRAGAGCLGVGCMTFLAFFIFLFVLAIGGGAWGILHLRKTYSSTEPLPIPQVATTDDSTVPPPPPPLPGIDPADAPPTPPSRPNPKADETQQRWKEFEKAARRHDANRIELTAADINALIAKGHNTRGKAFVSIQNNVGHVTVSVPLEGVMFMSGRYLNGEATIKASPDGDPGKLQITDVTVGNQNVPDDFLDRRIFGWNSIRGYVRKWLDEQNIVSVRIENDRAIGETGG